MRSRINLIFIALVMVLASTGYVVRSWAVQHQVREHDDAVLHHSAAAIAAAVVERTDSRAPVDRAYLSPLVAPGMAVRVHRPSGSDLEVRGAGFGGSLVASDTNDDLWALARLHGTGYVLVAEDASVVHGTAWESTPVMALILLVVALLAAIVGLLLGRSYERPFRRLADAAAALGRGRFQLDLPDSRIPAVTEIARALDASAHQLQDRLAGEDAFAQRASHALRTPLTGLRLELEEAAQDEGLTGEAATAVERSLRRVDQLEAVTTELITAARSRTLVEQAAIALGTIARQVTERWAEELEMRHRTLTATVEGDAQTTYTPGPVEQILELLLVDLAHRSAGPVRLVFTVGSGGHLRINVGATSAVPGRVGGGSRLARAHAVVTALGGRLEGEYADGGVEIVLPRR